MIIDTPELTSVVIFTHFKDLLNLKQKMLHTCVSMKRVGRVVPDQWLLISNLVAITLHIDLGRIWYKTQVNSQ